MKIIGNNGQQSNYVLINKSVEAENNGRIYQKFLPSASQVLRNINKIAISALIIYATSYVTGAEAGPVAYASCMAGCAAVPPICAAGGWAACLAALAAPTP